MIVSQKTQTLNFSEDINNLLCQIDVKISEISKQELDSKRFGFSNKIDENRFFILFNYRKILLSKANNNRCLNKYLVDDIINVIKQYISSGRVVKFTPIFEKNVHNIKSLKPGDTDTTVYYENGINMSVINKNYGDHIIYNSSFNRFVTENVTRVVEDDWEQIDW